MGSNGIDDSSQELQLGAALGFVPEPRARSMQWGKVLGLVATVLTILGAVIATPLWVVGRVDAAAAEVKTETKEAIEVHAQHPHDDAVPREVYTVHVEDAAKRDRALNTYLLRIEDKLDALGEKAYRSPGEWHDRTAPAPADK